jgi:hypothetical protein
MLFFLVFWSLIIFVPSTILNTDQIIDGTSNIIIEFEFFMITIVIVASVINRWTKKVNVKKFKYQIVIGILASIFCFSFATFSTLNDYIIAPIISPNDISSWGLFFSHDKPINILYQSIIFWAFALFFFFIPFINDLLIKISNKNYTEKLLWQK